ncbi:3-hydroxyacyl-ACP dehydratase FabZ family protein [Shewanella waksmanii]|uniref:3-hydroxyacyl-ACP dehydratase FabZ family protein n=1 Tax=Shewanella waksmanii TaxID=213783 RepID=UPI00048ED046|nr:thioester dehydrase [Shewanella waksmanii]
MIKSVLPPIISHSADNDEAHWRLAINAELPFFEGHFPQQPVLPGVTQLDWAIQLGAKHFGYAIDVASLEVLKFQQLMLPGTEVTLRISHKANKQKLVFTYYDGDKRYGSGRIAFVDKAIEQEVAQ